MIVDPLLTPYTLKGLTLRNRIVVLSGSRRPSGRVMVYADHGDTQALDVAEALARSGAQVEIVTPERTVSPDVGGIDGSDWRETKVFDAVVSDSGTAANAELYDLLLPDSVNQGEVDYDDLLALAVAGRSVHAAMLDAAQLCRAI